MSIPFQAGLALLPRFHMEMVRKQFSYLLDEGSHVQCTEWCLFCWLDNHCVTTAQCRSNFPGEHQEGEVPLEGKSKLNRWGKLLHYFFFFQAVTSQILKIVPTLPSVDRWDSDDITMKRIALA